jgi:hypothetical protein
MRDAAPTPTPFPTASHPEIGAGIWRLVPPEKARMPLTRSRLMGVVVIPTSLESADLYSFRREPQGRKVSSHNRISGEPTRQDRLAVIRFRQRTAWNLIAVVDRCADRWAKMREHEMLRAHALGQGAEIGGQALAIKGQWWKSAVPVRPQDRVVG